MAQQPAPSQPGVELSLRVLLEGLGFGGTNEVVARAALEEAGLTRPGKVNITLRKRDEVVRTLKERFTLSCPRTTCLQLAKASGRTILTPEKPTDCDHCGGSENRQAARRLLEQLRQHHLHKLVIVGGSPKLRDELERLLAGEIKLRLVDGVARRTKADAQADLRWADRVVIWGATQLDHKVSSLYTDFGDDKIVMVHRRGIAALADELAESIRRLSALPGKR